MSLLLPLSAVLACVTHLPSALMPSATTDPVSVLPAPATLDQALSQLVGRDPLLRRPPTQISLDAVPGAEPILAWQELVADPAAQPADWWALERSWPGSVAVVLARGARLADLESALAGGLQPRDAGRIVSLLTPLPAPTTTRATAVRAPLAWLETASKSAAAPGVPLGQPALVVQERSVLLGWLDAPELPLGPASLALEPGTYDRLLDSPAGHLIRQRAAGARDAGRAQLGRERLALATTLALTAAAADRDSQQTQLKVLLGQAADTLRAQGLTVPQRTGSAVDAALAAAVLDLTADAADDDSAGLALVALAAQRTRGRCPDPPCGGLDLSRSLRSAATWSPLAAQRANAWSVITAKAAVDHLEVTLGRPTFDAALTDLVDVLLGEAAGPIDPILLQQRTATSATWLALTRATAAPDSTDQAGGLAALGALMMRLCERALSTEEDPQRREVLSRIRDQSER